MDDPKNESELAHARQLFLERWREQRIKDPRTGDMSRFNPRAFWQAAHDVLLAFRRSELCDAITPSLVDELALLVDELLAGRIPDKVLPLLGAGAPSLRPVERRARVIAAAYVRFAREGFIKDDAPVRTIREKFGIGPSAATTWVKGHERGDLWLPSQELPLQVQANSVAWALNVAAEEYSQKGRGQKGRWKYRRQKRRRPLRGHTKTR